MTRASTSRANTRIHRALLLLLVLGSLGLRLWYAAADSSIDESRMFANLGVVLAGAPPPHAVPQSLTYLPHAVAIRGLGELREATGWAWIDVALGDDLSPRGPNLIRWLQAAIGVAGLIAVAGIGSRLHSPGLGLCAAALLAFAPLHIRGSTSFAPALLTATAISFALLGLLRAVERPGLVRFAVTGALLGLAVSASIAGAVVAVPVVLGVGYRASTDGASADQAQRRRRHFGYLLITAAMTLLVVRLLVPDLGAIAIDLAALAHEDGWQAMTERGSHLTSLVRGVALPAGSMAHGRWLGALAVATACGHGFACLFLTRPPRRRFEWLLVFATIATLVGSYALATPLFRAERLLPLLPFSALYAALALVGIWGYLWRRWARRVPYLYGLGLSAAVLPAVVAGCSYAHVTRVPTTTTLVQRWLELRFGELGPATGRIVVIETHDPRPWTDGRFSGKLPTLRVVRRLSQLAATDLDRVDAVVFRADRPAGPHTDLLSPELGGSAQTHSVRAGWLRATGPDWQVVFHPLTPSAAEPVQLEATLEPDRVTSELPAAQPGQELVSILVWVPLARDAAPIAPRVWLDGVALDPVLSRPVGNGNLFLSERVPTADRPRGIEAIPDPRGYGYGELAIAFTTWRNPDR